MVDDRKFKEHVCRTYAPAIESLEDRVVLTTFGLPWGDARHLTLSFAPDGSAIADQTSTLFQTLNARQATLTWERTILQAFQAWTTKANINIGLKTDGGQAFGVTGKNQHDSRFGDVRIGAQKMAAEVLAITVPSGSSLTGTWAGDMFLNSNAFSTANAPSLFGVTLHEAGHVFGLDDSTDPNSPMFSHLSGATVPTSADIANLQAMYGSRAPDSFEGSNGDNSINKAADFPIPGHNYNGDRPVALFADLTTGSDVDVYHIKPQSNYSGAMTVRLQSAGISLLAPHLTVTDAKGNILGEAQANSGFGDTVTVSLAHVKPGQDYYLRVDSKAGNDFAIGEYGLAVTFDGTNKTSPAVLDAVLNGDDGLLASRDIDAILRGDPNPFFNDDLHTDDSVRTAVGLVATPGFATGTHYEAVGSLSDAADVDFYQVTAARNRTNLPGVMTVTVRAMDVNGIAPSVTILDALQNPVASRVLANGNGTFTVQAVGIASGASYFVRVPGSSASGAPTGNYAVAVDFGTKSAQVTSFAGGSLASQTVPSTYDFYVAQSQLFEFLVTAGSAPTGASIQMTVSNTSGTILYSLTAHAGETVSGNALFLTPGAYVLTFAVKGVVSGLSAPLTYQLDGDSITDPVGPTLADPTLNPAPGTGTRPPVFAYPGNILTPWPYYFALRIGSR